MARSRPRPAAAAGGAGPGSLDISIQAALPAPKLTVLVTPPESLRLAWPGTVTGPGAGPGPSLTSSLRLEVRGHKFTISVTQADFHAFVSCVENWGPHGDTSSHWHSESRAL